MRKSKKVGKGKESGGRRKREPRSRHRLFTAVVQQKDRLQIHYRSAAWPLHKCKSHEKQHLPRKWRDAGPALGKRACFIWLPNFVPFSSTASPSSFPLSFLKPSLLHHHFTETALFPLLSFITVACGWVMSPFFSCYFPLVLFVKPDTDVSTILSEFPSWFVLYWLTPQDPCVNGLVSSLYAMRR